MLLKQKGKIMKNHKEIIKHDAGVYKKWRQLLELPKESLSAELLQTLDKLIGGLFRTVIVVVVAVVAVVVVAVVVVVVVVFVVVIAVIVAAVVVAVAVVVVVVVAVVVVVVVVKSCKFLAFCFL